MPSTISWLDTSEHDRRRVLDAIDLFKESEAREELGLGTIRDGFADDFFPGTSTIQTRAGYFLFIPWLYRGLQERGVVSSEIAAKAHKAEIQLIDALLTSDDTEGVIGKRAKGSLKRLPSLAYWAGLGEWQIRQFRGSVDEYHQLFEAFREPSSGARDDDRQLVSGSPRRDWHAALPRPPAGFPKVAEFKLRPSDATYLSERICLSHPHSLLAWLLRHGRTLDIATPWEHPQLDEFPERTRNILDHARCFAEASHGAAFLYNLMLAEALPVGDRRDDRVAYFRDALKSWSAELVPRRAALKAWRRDTFWVLVGGPEGLAHVTAATRAFVDRWLDMRGWEDVDALMESRSARDLITRRERQLKGPRARLGNARALELWGGDSGTALLVYRWPSAVRILLDLRPELGEADAAA
jgi:hypothetical protein